MIACFLIGSAWVDYFALDSHKFFKLSIKRMVQSFELWHAPNDNDFLKGIAFYHEPIGSGSTHCQTSMQVIWCWVVVAGGSGLRREAESIYIALDMLLSLTVWPGCLFRIQNSYWAGSQRRSQAHLIVIESTNFHFYVQYMYSICMYHIKHVIVTQKIKKESRSSHNFFISINSYLDFKVWIATKRF